MKRAKSDFLVLLICAAVATHAPGQSGSDAPAGGSLDGAEPGQERQDNGLAMKFVWCPPGELTMEQIEVSEKPVASDTSVTEESGQVEENLPVKVTLSQGFWVGRYEVTQNEWHQIMETTPWDAGKEPAPTQSDMAVTCVNWFDAMEFCIELSRQERAAGRLPAEWEYTLPTEVQWEYACRAQTETRFHFGDDDSTISEFAWVHKNASQAGEPYAHRVGQKRPNAWGLYDMHGNACEFCRDYYHEKRAGGADPFDSGGGWNRVLRGGCFNDIANSCRSSRRHGLSPVPRGNCIGFRVVLCPGDADSTEASVRRLKGTIPILVESSRSGPALEAGAVRAGAFPGDAPDVVAAIVRIHALEGDFDRNYRRADAPIARVHLYTCNRLRDTDLEQLKPLDSVRTVYVTFTSVTDDGLEHIARLPELQVLGLDGTKVTDTGMQTLERCATLQELYLGMTSIGDEGLQHVAGLRNLEVLSLADTPVTDAGLRLLAGLKKLKTLDLTGTRVSQSAVDKLQARLPDVTIESPKSVAETAPDTSPIEGTVSRIWNTTDLAGMTHSLEEYRGRVVILDFWFRQCYGCLRMMPQVNDVARHFDGQSVVVLGMSIDEKDEDAAAVVETMKLKYPVLKARQISEDYQIEGFPAILVIDQKGVIRKVHYGYSPILREDLIEIVERLLRQG